jgi:hypothetical protein
MVWIMFIIWAGLAIACCMAAGLKPGKAPAGGGYCWASGFYIRGWEGGGICCDIWSCYYWYGFIMGACGGIMRMAAPGIRAWGGSPPIGGLIMGIGGAPLIRPGCICC